MCVYAQLLSCVQLFAIPWTVAHQAPLSIEFPVQEYWSGLPFPSPGGLPDPGIKPRFPALQADSLSSEPPAICLHIFRVLGISFPLRSPGSTGESSLCCTVGSRQLSILYIAMYINEYLANTIKLKMERKQNPQIRKTIFSLLADNMLMFTEKIQEC